MPAQPILRRAPAPCGEGRAHDGRASVIAADSMRDSKVTMLQPEHVEELVVNHLDQDGAMAALRTARQVGSRERSGLVQGCGQGVRGPHACVGAGGRARKRT